MQPLVKEIHASNQVEAIIIQNGFLTFPVCRFASQHPANDNDGPDHDEPSAAALRAAA